MAAAAAATTGLILPAVVDLRTLAMLIMLVRRACRSKKHRWLALRPRAKALQPAAVATVATVAAVAAVTAVAEVSRGLLL